VGDKKDHNMDSKWYYPNNRALDKKLDEIAKLLLSKVGNASHKYPVGTKVRLIKGNSNKQWGTVAQHLLNGEYLIENSWQVEKLKETGAPDPVRYQVIGEEMIHPLDKLLTCADLSVGDKVKFMKGLRSQYNGDKDVYTITAIGKTKVVLFGTDWHGREVEFMQDPADLKLA